MGKNPIEFIIFNLDPERRSCLILALLGAHRDILNAIVNVEADPEEGKGQGKSVRLKNILLNVTYDGMPSFILAIGSYPYGEKN